MDSGSPTIHALLSSLYLLQSSDASVLGRLTVILDMVDVWKLVQSFGVYQQWMVVGGIAWTSSERLAECISCSGMLTGAVSNLERSAYSSNSPGPSALLTAICLLGAGTEGVGLAMMASKGTGAQQ